MTDFADPTPYDAAQLVAAVRACLDAGDRAQAERVALLSLEQARDRAVTAVLRDVYARTAREG